MRVLYGYRWNGDKAVVDPLAATVVCAVLAWPARQRTGISERAARVLQPGLTREAVHKLLQRIRSHAAAYRIGRAHARLAPDPRLILSSSPYAAGAVSCDSGCKLRRRPGCPPGRRR